MSTILLKDSHLFKIAELVINFYLNFFSKLAILNRYKSFSRMVNHVICLLCRPYNFYTLTSLFSNASAGRQYGKSLLINATFIPARTLHLDLTSSFS